MLTWQCMRMTSDGLQLDGDGTGNLLNVRQILIDLKVGSYIGTELAKRRPGRHPVGGSLVSMIDTAENTILAELARSAGNQDQQHLDRWTLPTDSPALADEASLADSPWSGIATVMRSSDNDPGRILLMVRYLTNAVLDNIRSLGILMQDPRSVRAPFALGRIAIDAEAQLLHIIESGITAEERIVRCLNMQLFMLGKDIKADLEAGDTVRADEHYAAAKAIMDGAINAGAVLVGADKPGKRSVRTIGTPASSSDLLSALHGDFEHAQTSHLLSTVIHSQDDSEFRLMAGLDGFENPHADQMMVIFLSPVILGYERCFEALAAYANLDLDAVTDAFTELASLWVVAAGENDAEITREIEVELADEISAIRSDMEIRVSQLPLVE